MRGTTRRDQTVELFGKKLKGPVLIGPTGMTGMLWPRGEIEAARAAAMAGTVYTMSHGSTVKMEDLARAPRLAMANYEREGDTGVFSIGARIVGWMDASANWKEVDWIRSTGRCCSIRLRSQSPCCRLSAGN